MRPERAPGRARRTHEDEEHPSHMAHDESNWLVSYADMMTLLFGFFVLMYSFSKVDHEKFQVVSKDLVKYFGGKVTENPGASEGVVKALEELKKGLTLEGVDSNSVSIAAKGDALVVSVGSDVLFSPGSAKPTDKTVAVINKVAESLKTVPIDLIEVEGHTDSDPISSALFPSNWELSTARASSIVRIFQRLNFPPAQLKAAGFADSRPVISEVDAAGAPIVENKTKNRRVVINIKTKPNEKLLNERLTKSGLDWRMQKNAPLGANAESGMTGDGELTDLQTRYEEMNRKLQNAQERLKEARDRQNKLKELEKLAKKTEEMEKKLKATERQTQEALEKGALNHEPAAH